MFLTVVLVSLKQDEKKVIYTKAVIKYELKLGDVRIISARKLTQKDNVCKSFWLSYNKNNIFDRFYGHINYTKIHDNDINMKNSLS